MTRYQELSEKIGTMIGRGVGYEKNENRYAAIR
jgi:hypothetical protein